MADEIIGILLLTSNVSGYLTFVALVISQQLVYHPAKAVYKEFAPTQRNDY